MGKVRSVFVFAGVLVGFALGYLTKASTDDAKKQPPPFIITKHQGWVYTFRWSPQENNYFGLAATKVSADLDTLPDLDFGDGK